MADVKFDTSSFNRGISDLQTKLAQTSQAALFGIGGEILRLSNFEVPHDEGILQASGHVEPDWLKKDAYVVGYNKVYAARLHENPQFRFQKGRKGKYLEDPIKNNLQVFLQFYKDAMKGLLG